MDIQQTNELTYTKVNEIDARLTNLINVVTEISPESSTTVKEQVQSTKNNTDSIKTNVEIVRQTVEDNSQKLDSILENQNNNSSGGNIDFSSIEEKISEVNNNITNINENITLNNDNITTIHSNISTLSQNLNNISNDVTTTNSNVATNKSNITSIKTSVENIENNIPSSNQYNIFDQKLNDLIRRVKNLEGEDDEFSEDPYKLEMNYTGRIETHRSLDNYVFVEKHGDFTTNHSVLICLAHCESSTFKYNFKLSFTVPTSARMYFNTNNSMKNIIYQAGKYDIEITSDDITVLDDKIIFQCYITSNSVIVHNAKLELFADNIILLPKRNKYKVTYAPDNICISKIENNNGYYLSLNNIETLTPKMLEQEYTLGVENIIDFGITYDFYLHKTSKKYALDTNMVYITPDYHFHAYYANGYKVAEEYNYPVIECDCASNDNFYNVSSIIILKTSIKPMAGYMKSLVSASNTVFGFQQLNTAKINFVSDTYRFENSKPLDFVITTIQGITYFYHHETKASIELGYGQNATAFYHLDDPLKVNIYMNDGGYCIKSVIQMNEDKTQITLLSQSIIGTYDAYFETTTDIYFVEKDQKLYMFKKGSLNHQSQDIIESESSTEG